MSMLFSTWRMKALSLPFWREFYARVRFAESDRVLARAAERETKKTKKKRKGKEARKRRSLFFRFKL